MMKAIPTALLWLAGLLLAQCSFRAGSSLSDPYTRKYADRIEAGSVHIYSTFNTSLERTQEGAFVFKQYYPSTGQLTDFITYEGPRLQVLRGLCDPIREECERVVYQLDRWRPGLQNGEPVRVLFHLPIRFRLE